MSVRDCCDPSYSWFACPPSSSVLRKYTSPPPPLLTLPVNFRRICWNFVLWGRRFCQSFHHDDCLGMLKTGLPGGAFFIFLTGIVLSFIL